MLPGAAVWSLAYKARLRGIRITITIAGLIGIRVAIAVVIAVIIAISASATITVVVLTVSELTVIRMELLIGKEGRFAINLLLLLLVYNNGRL